MNIDIDIDLEREQEQQFYLFLKQNHLELSDFFKKIILEQLIEETTIIDSPYELGKDVFGRFSSGKTENSVERKRLIREKIHGKYRYR